MTASRPLFGIETEYALAGLRPDGTALSTEYVLRAFMEKAACLVHLADARGGLFLANGARLYADYGNHPELATAECTDPGELVGQVLAGHRTLEGVARRVAACDPAFGEVLLMASNVDYSGAHTTWGCHESYQYRIDPETMAEQILPHLVSRLIFSGAGGFDPRSAGLHFSLSPRAHHLELASSPDSTRSRGLFHTKDEPLSSSGHHRLHLICGDSLRSERGTWLKVGTTALVVATIDAGGRPADAVRLADPVKALRTVSADPDCNARVALQNGGCMSTVELQSVYLEHVERTLGGHGSPPWAEDVVRAWREVLERVAGGPASLNGTLDWAIKRAVYEGFLRKRGFTWGSTRRWSLARVALAEAWWNAGQGALPRDLDAVLGWRSPIRPAVNRIDRLLKAWGEAWEGLERFETLRQELFEIDTRYAQLGERGLFAMLEQQGVLAHRLHDRRPIVEATRAAPSGSRARLRGEWVRRLAGDGSRYQCDWAAIWDLHQRRVLGLCDPFAREAAWESMPAADLEPAITVELGP